MSNAEPSESIIQSVTPARHASLLSVDSTSTSEISLDNTNTSDKVPRSPNGEEEDALDEGEILELQAFIPRREWIEEKIKFLEQLPPVELFEHLEFLLSVSHEPIPGLPTREQLDEWMKQHDVIEQEAERFDSNDMKRLKKFAKAATKRNLSPADTDLIEVTLTTLLSLDKLVHLLRSRSEFLDLIGLRLTWEEKRLGVWSELEAIKNEMGDFITKTARWNPETYQQATDAGANSSPSSLNVAVPGRDRSLSSISSISSRSTASIPGRKNSVFSNVSRSSRYKLAEDLTRESGRYSTRVAAWKRNFVAPAGKALDRMIEKKTVPDPVLDEQDRLEDNVRPLESVARFGMEVVGQWKKADELYGELKKDQGTAATLQDEVDAALQNHPNSRQDAGFMTRCQALDQRLSNFANLANPRLFPKPIHPSFPDQPSCNDAILSALSQELAEAKTLAGEASESAREYHRRVGLVKQAEDLRTRIQHGTNKLLACASRLTHGTSAEDGDGSPLQLDSTDCLDPFKHGAYLAILPLTSKELDEARGSGDEAAESCRKAMRSLAGAPLDEEFSASIDSALKEFEEAKNRAKSARDDVMAKASALREVRKIWSGVGEIWKDLDTLKLELSGKVERAKWVPIGQEQPARSPLPSSITSWPDTSNITPRLDALTALIPPTTTIPTQNLNPLVGQPVSQAVIRGTDVLQQYLENLRGMDRLFDSIKNQSLTMSSVHREELELEDKIDGLIARLSSAQVPTISVGTAVTNGTRPSSNSPEHLEREYSALSEEISQFCSNLSTRIPFIGKPDSYFPGPLRSSQLNFSGLLHSDIMGNPSAKAPFALPLDVASLDHNVRTDANGLSIRISTRVQQLSQQLDHLRLKTAAQSVDGILQNIREKILGFEATLQDQREIATKSVLVDETNIPPHEAALQSLEECLKFIETVTAESRELTSQAVPSFRTALRDLLSMPTAQESSMQETIILPSMQKEKELESILENFASQLESATQVISSALQAEKDAIARLTQLAEEEAKRIEAERLAKEEQERAERLRLEEEARQRELEAEAERARIAEAQRLEAELKEKQRQEELERVRLAEEARLKEEEEQRKREVEEEEKRLRQLEEEARLLAIKQEEERLRALAQQLEEEQKRLQEEQELARQQEDEQKRLKEEQERLKREEEEQKRKRDEEELARKKEEEEQRRIQEEERLRRIEEEDRRIKEQRELAQKQAEEEQLRIKQEQELARQRLEEEQKRLQEEDLRLKQLELEQQRLREGEEKQRILREEERLREEAERARLLQEEQARLEQEELAQLASTSQVDDIFSPTSTTDIQALLASIEDLRNRLRSLSLENRAKALADSIHSSSLPSASQVAQIQATYAEIQASTEALPSTYDDPEVGNAYKSLIFELGSSKVLLDRCQELAWVSNKVSACDSALSDLLEHIDRYPTAPAPSDLQSNHISDLTQPPEVQLSARVDFTELLIKDLDGPTKSFAPDERVVSERERLEQTWTELQEMSADRLANKSRPSTASGKEPGSGRSSSLSVGSRSSASASASSQRVSSSDASQKLKGLLKGISKAPSKKPRGNLGLGPSPRTSSVFGPDIAKTPSSRTASTLMTPRPNRTDPKLHKKRSASGPLVTPNSGIFRSTFSSRQRTSSTTSDLEPPTPIRSSLQLTRSPMKTPKALRSDSPSFSDSSSNNVKPRSVSAYLRTPRQASISKTPKATPKPAVRKPYVANPKNKLDVAVGNIVNKMSVSVPIQPVASPGWEDKSGKYWIGDDEDAKLCFCRILRSQTVMVRVGGGWCELGKFLKDHFAYLMDQIPEPPKLGSVEEKWISSRTVSISKDNHPTELPELPKSLTAGPPRTPEPKGRGPTVLLHTPSGASPHSLNSGGSPGSPLTPLQFIRKAEDSPKRTPGSKRSEDSPKATTTPLPHRLSKSTTARTPARGSQWRL